MGKLALAAKITHVPSMYLSEFAGPNFGCRDAAIAGHNIKNMPYAYPGNPALGHMIGDMANAMGVKSRAHSDTTLGLEYGPLGRFEFRFV